MKIELFSNEDFAKAFPLAAGAWGEFYADERQWFIDAVAEYILRYNYSNPSLALKAVGDDGVIHGVLFANFHDDRDLRHLYLWTDTSCTHEYYPQHGFTLVSQFLSEVYDSYAPGYTTYIYKKGI